MKKTIIKALATVGACTTALHRLNQALSIPSETQPHDTAKQCVYPWSEGDIVYQVTGSGDPILLIHGMGIGCSSYEWRKNIDVLAKHYKVYTLDLLGYGCSDKPNISYTAFTYIHLIRDFIIDVIQQPTHVIGSSHGASFCIRLAKIHPELLRCLVLICPTGVEQELNPPSSYVKALQTVSLSLPVYRTTLYYSIASKLHMKYFLQRYLYANEENITDDLVDRYYLNAHQDGQKAARAPLAFLKGDLNIHISSDWEALAHPALLVWGEESELHPIDHLSQLRELNSNAEIQVYTESGILPHDEEAYLFNGMACDFIQRHTH
ncbi:alpha/beta fold hydrolase [Caldalkalibacillus salinus]|uniref:alpha/beta fold hydrolase n=1 Tax=Caldalkalibacillus salinus TaxID=2803787 RepID=UPI001921285F|nr:alpha/beta fold hydrolase [Caldalkalibacillus salinus]